MGLRWRVVGLFLGLRLGFGVKIKVKGSGRGRPLYTVYNQCFWDRFGW